MCLRYFEYHLYLIRLLKKYLKRYVVVFCAQIWYENFVYKQQLFFFMSSY